MFTTNLHAFVMVNLSFAIFELHRFRSIDLLLLSGFDRFRNSHRLVDFTRTTLYKPVQLGGNGGGEMPSRLALWDATGSGGPSQIFSTIRSKSASLRNARPPGDLFPTVTVP